MQVIIYLDCGVVQTVVKYSEENIDLICDYLKDDYDQEELLEMRETLWAGDGWSSGDGNVDVILEIVEDKFNLGEQ